MKEAVAYMLTLAFLITYHIKTLYSEVYFVDKIYVMLLY